MRTSNPPWDQDKCPNMSPPTRTPSSSHLSRELTLWLSPSPPGVPRGPEATLSSRQKPRVPSESGGGLLDKGEAFILPLARGTSWAWLGRASLHRAAQGLRELVLRVPRFTVPCEWLSGKDSPCQETVGSIPGSGRSLGEGNGNRL